tara:strand:+ start:64 stop:1098 length:1035 start_codon:yes stop_codon:yes gene_type:complete
MKKLLGIVVLCLLWCTIALADLYDLKIDLNTSEKTTDKILIKNGYSSKCETTLADSNESALLLLTFDSYANKVDMTLGLEVTGSDSGILAFKYSAKINQDGSIGKKKLIEKEFSGTSNFKKEMKPYVNVFKNMSGMIMDEQGYYPDYGKPLRSIPKIIDGKKLFKRMINLVAKSAPKQSGQLKKAGSHIAKNSDINVSKEFIGYSEINGERYNLIRYKFKINYNGNKSEYRSFANQFNIDQIVFFHESGLPTITYDIIPTSDTMMNHSLVCKIFKNNSLITEISVPILKDASKLKKIKKKSKKKSEKKLESNEVVGQLEKLNDLYKSGVLTKEEFEKAKKKILN